MIFKDRRYRVYRPIVFALIMLLGMWAGIKLAPQANDHGSMFAPTGERYNKVSDLMNYILGNYVDSVSKEDLTEDAIEGILKDLDPHSQYISADVLSTVNEDLMGNFEGIGIQFRIESDTITVIQTIADGPSEKVGLLAGDRIDLVGADPLETGDHAHRQQELLFGVVAEQAQVRIVDAHRDAVGVEGHVHRSRAPGGDPSSRRGRSGSGPGSGGVARGGAVPG